MPAHREEVPAASVWERRLGAAVEALLAAFVLLALVEKWREGADALAAAAAVCALALTFLRGLPPARRRLTLFFAGALTVFLAANLLAWALAEPMPARGGFEHRRMHVTGVLAAMAVGLGLRRPGAVRRTLGWTLAVAGAVYLAELLSLPWRQAYIDGRLAGFRRYPTLLAGELAIMATLHLGWVLASRSRRTAALALAGAGLSAALLVMTRGRAGLLALGGVGVPAVCLFQTRLGPLRQRAIAAGIWFLLVGPAAGLLWWTLSSPERRSGTTVRSRLDIYRVVFQVAAKAPWYRAAIGHGASTRVYAAAAEHYRADSPVILGQRVIHAHNNILQVFLESGLLGVAALCAVWLAGLRSAWLGWRRADAERAPVAGMLLAALAVVAAAGMPSYSLWKVVGQLSWLVVGLAFAAGTEPAGERPPARTDAGTAPAAPGGPVPS